MDKIASAAFENASPDFEKLKNYGFALSDGVYTFEKDVADGIKAKINVTSKEVFTQVVDSATGEAYTLFLAESATGSFVGEVRKNYDSFLKDVADKCFIKSVFETALSKFVIDYVEKTYGDKLEFLWEKFSKNAIWRRKDNQKWYGAILTVRKNKLGLDSDSETEVIDLRALPETIEKLVDNKTFFAGYHMNKKHWITMRLDGSVPLETICKMIDESYILAKKL